MFKVAIRECGSTLWQEKVSKTPVFCEVRASLLTFWQSLKGFVPISRDDEHASARVGLNHDSRFDKGSAPRACMGQLEFGMTPDHGLGA